jgi:hypothetical protein
MLSTLAREYNKKEDVPEKQLMGSTPLPPGHANPATTHRQTVNQVGDLPAVISWFNTGQSACGDP